MRYTTKGGNVYAVTLGMPQAGTVLTLQGFTKEWQEKVKRVTALGTNQTVAWEKSDEGLKITTPQMSGEMAVAFRIETGDN